MSSEKFCLVVMIGNNRIKCIVHRNLKVSKTSCPPLHRPLFNTFHHFRVQQRRGIPLSVSPWAILRRTWSRIASPNLSGID